MYQDGTTAPELLLFLIGGETATNTDFSPDHEYRRLRRPGSLDLDYLVAISPSF